jgi:hypothetical protein
MYGVRSTRELNHTAHRKKAMKTKQSKFHLTRTIGTLAPVFGAMFAVQARAAPDDQNPVVVSSGFIAGGEGGSTIGNESGISCFVPQVDEC